MDIHPPEHPIRSVRDFCLQIFTVTCGIIIALGLEGLLVAHREARLAHATRGDFIIELDDNLARLREVRKLGTGAEAWFDTAINWAQAHLEHKALPPPSVIGSRTFPHLQNAAWETAQATQAMPLLTLPETRALATAYSHQNVMNDLVAHALEQWINLAGYDFDPTQFSDPDLRDVLRQLRIAYAYQHSMNTIEDKLIGECQEARKVVAAAE